MPKLALSYRRQDAPAMAGRIRDKLALHYGADAVFMDIDSVPLGMDFREHLDRVFNDVGALLVIVGPKWLSEKPDGTHRIQDKRDYVRIEITAALKRNIPVIPILVEGAEMPREEDLPEELSSLVYRQAAEVDTGIDFHVHVDRIIRSLDRLFAPPLATSPAASQETPPLPKTPVDPPPLSTKAATKASASAGNGNIAADRTTRIIEVARAFAVANDLDSKKRFYTLEVPDEEIKHVRGKLKLDPSERVLAVAVDGFYGNVMVMTDAFVHFRIKVLQEKIEKVRYEELKDGLPEFARVQSTIASVLQFDRPGVPITHKTFLDLLKALQQVG